ncbi:MAG TPA: uracil-DNA glycosylase family protein [Gemmatirosa sp.]
MSGDGANARDRLRQYLEQRRELGETELVLDTMSVDDVLRVIGVGRAGAPLKPRRPRPAADPPADSPVDTMPEASTTDEVTPATEATAMPVEEHDDAGAPADHPQLRGGGAPADVAPPPSPALEPEPADRVGQASDASLDAAATGDWRSALRAADADAPNDQPPTLPPMSDAPTPAYVSGDLFPGLDVPVGLIAAGAGTELFGGPTEGLDTLERLAEAVRSCTRCQLYRTATNGVPGEGPPDADFVVVGEAPGADEDASGRPFVGASGQLLTKILAAINLRREDVFIANVVKHRPPGNRNPAPDEVAACSPYLVRQLELLRPKVILTVGNFAAQTLLGTKLGISKLRGQVHLYHGVPLVATYHPAALLRNPTWKRPTWEDVQLARRLLDRAAASG